MAANFCLVGLLGVSLGCFGAAKKDAPANAGQRDGEYCAVAEIIIGSRRDTPETLRQIRRENAKQRRMKCPEDK